MGIVDEYIKETTKYKSSHGDKTVVLMQCGTFFEIYGLKDKCGVITGSDLVNIAEICELNIANKKICVQGKNVVMAGFGLQMIDKYLRKLNEKGYTCPVIVQDVQAANSPRSLKGIYSPGTNFMNETNNLTNNIMCLWININNSDIFLNNSLKQTIVCGSACVDIYTGKSFIQQFSNEYLHNPATFDELEKFVSIYNPCETIIIHNFGDENKINDIINFVNIQSSKIHKISSEQQKVINCEKQTYQKQIIEQYYETKDNENIYLELSNYCIACEAYCYLLNFLYESDPSLVSKIHEPYYETVNNDKLATSNHSLKQLNIIEDSNYKGKLSSIATFLNNAVTPMGKRAFEHLILHPISDSKLLIKEYDITEYLITTNKLSSLRTNIQDIKDLEKLNRKLLKREITPVNFVTIHDNIETIRSVYKGLCKDKILNKYLLDTGEVGSNSDEIQKGCDEILNSIKYTLDIKACKDINTVNIDRNIIKEGVIEELDNKIEKWHERNDILECVRKYLNNMLLTYETSRRKTTSTNASSYEYIKIHDTEKSGCTLQLTQKRAKTITEELKRMNITGSIELSYISSYSSSYKSSNETKTYILNVDDLEFVTATGTNKNIMGSQMQHIYKSITTTKTHMLDEVVLQYKKYVNNFIELSDKFLNVINYITKLDVLQNKVYISVNNNLCKPKIVNTDKSYFNCKGLRHLLIENLNTSELYVANDIRLGDMMDGMLIYGTNAVGKTSLIRALGITIIMAQSGLYVPCSEMDYNPYTQIFTRILGNDNIFKGLSTFAVEMSELRTILKYADKNSLILGDELCSGTETESATAIFISGVTELHNKSSSFVFATHFHEITDRDEIKELKKLELKHMTVRYDESNDILIYDRILKDTAGNSSYGLEVCKSLSMPEDFLKRAHDIRIKYNPKDKGILSMNTSRYNSEKIVGNCELCNKIASETHHMYPQESADEMGFIDGFKKNHKANLMSICKECHKKVTSNKTIHKKHKTTIGICLEEI